MRLGLALAIVLAAVAAGCGGGSPAIRDGLHFGFVVHRGHSTIEFDEAQFLRGEAAQKAAEQDGEVAPGEPVSNDYYIRDLDRRTTTLRVATGVQVTVVRCPTSCRQGIPGRFSALRTGGDHPPYWVTTKGGVVTRIDQQYVP